MKIQFQIHNMDRIMKDKVKTKYEVDKNIKIKMEKYLQDL